MNSKDYWAKRSALDMVGYMRTADRTSTLMRQTSEQALDVVRNEIKGIFGSFTSFGISEAEARRILSADGTTLRRMRRAAERLADPDKKKALLSAINSAGAYRWRIQRLEQVAKQVTEQCRELYKAQLADTAAALRSVAGDAYYHTIFNLQKETGLAFSFAQLPSSQIDKILAFHWAGGHYSERIWRNTEILAQSIKDELLVSLLSGRSDAKTVRAIREQFGVNSFCAWRLIRTESAYVANAAVGKSYEEAGIERYRFAAVLDSKTSEKCAELDGRVFDLKDAKPGTNYPPMHPFCRSTTIADFGEDTLAGLERRARDKDGNIIKVPADMTYREWAEKYLDKSAGSGIIKVGSGRMTISSIDSPIEQKHTGKGNPNAILTFDVSLNNRQQELLDNLPEYDSRITVPRDSVNMADLSALTARTGDEFAMFTKSNERLIIRGNYARVNIDVEEAKRLAAQGYKWSGHTHPGTDINVMIPSTGDKEILKCFSQEISVIYNSKGNFRTFEKE